MDHILSAYLEKVNKYLKSMPVDERADIILEIKSEIIELQSQGGLSSTQILERLGEPKKLAKAYLGESIAKTKGPSVKKLGEWIAFYSLVGLSGMIVLPVTSIMAAAFLFSGIVAPIAGAVKLLASILGFDLPIVMFEIGSFVATPIQAFGLSVIIGILLLAAGYGMWKVTLMYVKAVSAGSRKLRE